MSSFVLDNLWARCIAIPKSCEDGRATRHVKGSQSRRNERFGRESLPTVAGGSEWQLLALPKFHTSLFLSLLSNKISQLLIYFR